MIRAAVKRYRYFCPDCRHDHYKPCPLTTIGRIKRAYTKRKEASKVLLENAENAFRQCRTYTRGVSPPRDNRAPVVMWLENEGQQVDLRGRLRVARGLMPTTDPGPMFVLPWNQPNPVTAANGWHQPWQPTHVQMDSFDSSVVPMPPTPPQGIRVVRDDRELVSRPSYSQHGMPMPTSSGSQDAPAVGPANQAPVQMLLQGLPRTTPGWRRVINIVEESPQQQQQQQQNSCSSSKTRLRTKRQG